ncbi:hypothetical protein DL546_009352 [Coniochaeta pulveracea]|uniref:AB hydrolase-1 domain-containing protein n=1 Tax=Coniochaeta pulveracea TaxID=177199 RepID=A0A420YJ72_9PEZI|nr:hypothetical protein DL546_009352 [Coniochaeta pulveracea]
MSFPARSFPPRGNRTDGGTYAINGLFCKPIFIRNEAVLEILVHGITYNKTMWSGLGFGDYYNWHSFASLQGYYTLAIDRLGHGTNPQHPDPLTIVEGALQEEIVQQLIKRVRSSPSNPLGRQFEQITRGSLSSGDTSQNILLRPRQAY